MTFVRQQSRACSAILGIALVLTLVAGGYGMFLASEAGRLPWQADPTRIPVTPFSDFPGFGRNGRAPATPTSLSSARVITYRSGRHHIMAADASQASSPNLLVVEDEDPDPGTRVHRPPVQGVHDRAGGNRPRGAWPKPAMPTFDLLLLDVNLPDVDGFEICRKLRADGNDVPVIFLTARDDPGDLRAGFTGGGDDYLTKPFSLEELVLRIEAVLRRTAEPGIRAQPSHRGRPDPRQ